MNPNYVIKEDEKQRSFRKNRKEDRAMTGLKSPGHQDDSMDAELKQQMRGDDSTFISQQQLLDVNILFGSTPSTSLATEATLKETTSVIASPHSASVSPRKSLIVR